MFCGACIEDNKLAQALIQLGHSVSLIPLYTPLRLDEKSFAEQQIFMGGINIYLNQNLPGWKSIPRWMNRWLDNPKIIKLATSMGVSNDAQNLGELTLSMLRGAAGPQARLINELADFIASHYDPRVIIFSNLLVSGAAPVMRKRFNCPIYSFIQGDDVFLDQLQPAYKTQAVKMIHENQTAYTGFLYHSDFYRTYMSEYLGLDTAQGHLLPLGISPADIPRHHPHRSKPWTIGYFARIAPEKGLLPLVHAFKKFHALNPDSRLVVGGYLNSSQHKYFAEVQQAAKSLGSAFDYRGSPNTEAEKSEIMQDMDVLTVPAVFQEPKGIYVLEAWMHGIPVVLPDRGAFPEMVHATQGGLLYPPDATEQLLEHWQLLKDDPVVYEQYSQAAYVNMRKFYSNTETAKALLRIVT